MRKESYMKHELTMAEIAKFQKEYKKEPQCSDPHFSDTLLILCD